MFTSATKLSDIALQNYQVIPLLDKFGISLGLGDATVGSVCKSKGIDTDFFLTLLHTYLQDDYLPEVEFPPVAVTTLIRYLDKANGYCSNILLPNIERHFKALQLRSEDGQPNNLEFLWKFFLELRNELLARIDFDRTIWFPSLHRMAESKGLDSDVNIISNVPADERGVEDKVDDLISFFVIHLRGDYDHNLCMAVVTALSSLEKEIRCTNRIRERILRPLSYNLVESYNHGK